MQRFPERTTGAVLGTGLSTGRGWEGRGCRGRRKSASGVRAGACDATPRDVVVPAVRFQGLAVSASSLPGATSLQQVHRGPGGRARRGFSLGPGYRGGAPQRAGLPESSCQRPRPLGSVGDSAR